jgi:hypothetical protein
VDKGDWGGVVRLPANITTPRTDRSRNERTRRGETFTEGARSSGQGGRYLKAEQARTMLLNKTYTVQVVTVELGCARSLSTLVKQKMESYGILQNVLNACRRNGNDGERLDEEVSYFIQCGHLKVGYGLGVFSVSFRFIGQSTVAPAELQEFIYYIFNCTCMSAVTDNCCRPFSSRL